MNLRLEDHARFWDKVRCDGPAPDAAKYGNIGRCWPWTAARNATGYGVTKLGGKVTQAHRIAFLEHGGELTAEKPFTLHRCDNPGCCNPTHLFAGSAQDNVADMMKKGRHAPQGGKDNGNARLTEGDVLEIRSLWDRNSGLTQGMIAERFGVDRTLVNKIVLRKRWPILEEAA